MEAKRTEICSITVLQAQNPKSRCQWRHAFSVDSRGECFVFLSSEWWPTGLGVSWLVPALFQSLLLWSHGVLLILSIFHIVSVSSIGVFMKIKGKTILKKNILSKEGFEPSFPFGCDSPQYLLFANNHLWYICYYPHVVSPVFSVFSIPWLI